MYELNSGVRLNRITLPVSGDDGSIGKTKTYDLEK